MKKRNFSQLKEMFTLQELIEFCKNIAEEYANLESQYARSYFCNKYEITTSCFYKILEYAVITNLIEDVIVHKMMEKAIKNQNLHKNGAGISSIIKYAKMYTKRYKYIAETMIEEEVKDLARDFGDNPDITKAEFASAYGVNQRVIDFCLERAIKDNIADDKTVSAIEKRSIKNAKAENITITKKYFSDLRKERKANILRNYP